MSTYCLNNPSYDYYTKKQNILKILLIILPCLNKVMILQPLEHIILSSPSW